MVLSARQPNSQDSRRPLDRLAFPAPRRGSLIIAQGKAAEAAALGKTPPPSTSFFPSGLARRRRTKPEGNHFATATQGGFRFAGLPWAVSRSSLRDFNLPPSARATGERRWSPGRDHWCSKC